jgi:hypothetical protein
MILIRGDGKKAEQQAVNDPKKLKEVAD